MDTEQNAHPRHVKVGDITINGNNREPFVLIAGPDSLEEYDRTNAILGPIYDVTQKLGIPWIIKMCYDKSQRTSKDNWRGNGDPSLTPIQRLENAIPLYDRFKRQYGAPITADFSTVEEAKLMGGIVDLLQVQARLFRMTDILVAAGQYGLAVNIKRGHGESTKALPGAIGKVASTGNHNIIVTERGTAVGEQIYVDMPLLEEYKAYGYPVCLDVSHPCQLPSADHGKSGGQRERSFPLARAGIGIGIAALFMEVYDQPEIAPVDGPHSMLLSDLPRVLKKLSTIDRAVKEY